MPGEDERQIAVGKLFAAMSLSFAEPASLGIAWCGRVSARLCCIGHMTAVRFDFCAGAQKRPEPLHFSPRWSPATRLATIMRSMLSVSYGIWGVSPNPMRARVFRENWLGTWIRTRTNGVRVRWSTVNLFPKPLAVCCPASVWRAYKQKNARCKYLLPKKCGRAVSFLVLVLSLDKGLFIRRSSATGRGRAVGFAGSAYGSKKSLAKGDGAGTVAPTQNRRERLSGRQASRCAVVETSERPRSRR